MKIVPLVELDVLTDHGLLFAFMIEVEHVAEQFAAIQAFDDFIFLEADRNRWRNLLAICSARDLETARCDRHDKAFNERSQVIRPRANSITLTARSSLFARP